MLGRIVFTLFWTRSQSKFCNLTKLSYTCDLACSVDYKKIQTTYKKYFQTFLHDLCTFFISSSPFCPFTIASKPLVNPNKISRLSSLSFLPIHNEKDVMAKKSQCKKRTWLHHNKSGKKPLKNASIFTLTHKFPAWCKHIHSFGMKLCFAVH